MKKIILLAFSALTYALPASANPLYVEIFINKGDILVRAGKAEGLKVGASIQIVGGAIGGTSERRKLGGAIVVEAWDHLAKVSLDEEVERHRGKRWAKLDAEELAGNEASNAPVTVATKTKGGLVGSAELDRKFIFKKQVIVHNYSKTAWTQCELRLPDNTIYGPVRVEPQVEYTVLLSRFTQDGEPRDAPIDHILVRCAEGSADFGLNS